MQPLGVQEHSVLGGGEAQLPELSRLPSSDQQTLIESASPSPPASGVAAAAWLAALGAGESPLFAPVGWRDLETQELREANQDTVAGDDQGLVRATWLPEGLLLAQEGPPPQRCPTSLSAPIVMGVDLPPWD